MSVLLHIGSHNIGNNMPYPSRGTDPPGEIDYFRTSFPLISDWTIDISFVTFVSLALFCCTRDLYVSARAASFENPHLQIVLNTRHPVHCRISDTSATRCTQNFSQPVVDLSVLWSVDWEALSTMASQSDRRRLKSHFESLLHPHKCQ